MTETMAGALRCPNCGAAARPDAAFCPACGGPLRAATPVTPPPASGAAGAGRPPSAPTPPAYAAPPPFPPPPPASDRMSQARTATNGFFGSLFDWGFTSFVTPKLVKIGYLVGAVYLGLGWLLFSVAALAENAAFGLFVLVFGGIATVLALMMMRLFFEFLMVVFRAAVDVHDTMKQRDVG